MAQVTVDRTQAPKPAPAPIIKAGEPAFVLPNGLKVFVAEIPLPWGVAILTIDREAVRKAIKPVWLV